MMNLILSIRKFLFNIFFVGIFFLILIWWEFKQLGDWILFSVLLTMICYLLYLAYQIKNIKVKLCFIYASSALFAIAIFECYWLNKNRVGPISHLIIESYTKLNYYSSHSYLGYGPKQDGVFRFRKIVNFEVIYDVKYTIQNSRRYVPNSNCRSDDVAFFLGCSYTFGDGVNDTNTTSFIFNELAHRKYKVFNYGFHGYGPHQMLAIIEKKVPVDLRNVRGKRIAVYTFLPLHLNRAAGESSWDPNGPQYEIVNGKLQKIGTFNNGKSFLERTRLFVERLFKEKEAQTSSNGNDHKDLMRTIEIIKESNKLLKKLNVEFYVLIWDIGFSSSYYKNYKFFFIRTLEEENIRLMYVSNVIKEDELGQYIFPYDCHPNEKATKKIGEYLFNHIENFK